MKVLGRDSNVLSDVSVCPPDLVLLYNSLLPSLGFNGDILFDLLLASGDGLDRGLGFSFLCLDIRMSSFTSGLLSLPDDGLRADISLLLDLNGTLDGSLGSNSLFSRLSDGFSSLVSVSFIDGLDLKLIRGGWIRWLASALIINHLLWLGWLTFSKGSSSILGGWCLIAWCFILFFK